MKLLRLIRTIRHLKPYQVYYQLFYRLTKRLNNRPEKLVLPIKYAWLNAKQTTSCGLSSSTSFTAPASFNFLKLNVTFEKVEKIDWDYSKYGKLFTYNLNYFDWILSYSNKEVVKEILLEYCSYRPLTSNKYEPYPTSLRLVNWITFYQLDGNEPQSTILEHIIESYTDLWKKREFHLSGNHLLENSIALFLGCIVLNDHKKRSKSISFLSSQLSSQYLDSGLHYERSFTYHSLLFFRQLLAYSIVAKIDELDDEVNTFISHWKVCLDKQFSVLKHFTVRPKNQYPRFNDIDPSSPPPLDELKAYAESVLGDVDSEDESIDVVNCALTSGYHLISSNYYSSIIDIGPIGPDHIPGHGHCDALSICMFDNTGAEILTEVGTSTYETNERRLYERSTSAHNTVELENTEQSEIWGSFRVGKRANISVDQISETHVVCSHDGYLKTFGATHQRSVKSQAKKLVIEDSILGNSEVLAKARFHFPPGKQVSLVENELEIQQAATLTFEGSEKIELLNYQYARGFNDLQYASVGIVHFRQKLKTSIQLT